MKKLLVTHNGQFHADDLFATAALQLLHPDLVVERTRDEARVASADFVVDVGGNYSHEAGRYDHHQKGGAGTRANGIPFASIGLVWKHYGIELSKGSKEVADWVDTQFVQPIDATDVGVSICKPLQQCGIPSINSLVRLELPTWQEDEGECDERFQALLPWAKHLIERAVVVGEATVAARVIVAKAIEGRPEPEVLELQKKVPWFETVIEHDKILYVVHPDPTVPNRWRAYAAQKAFCSFETRKPFPKRWAGLRDEELAEETTVPGALFCHLAGHLVVADSYEGIKKLVHLAIAA